MSNNYIVSSNLERWAGLYMDGKLVMEDHELNWEEVFKLLKVNCKFISPDEEWLAENGSLPKKFKSPFVLIVNMNFSGKTHAAGLATAI